MVAALFEVLSYNELNRKLFDEHDWHLLSDCTVSDWSLSVKRASS